MANTMGWPSSSINYIAAEIEKTEVYRKLMMKLHQLVTDPEVSSDTLEDHIRILINESGYKQKLRNQVYQYIVKNPNLRSNIQQRKEPLEYIQKAQINWEHRITKSLNNMSNELSMVFSRKRPVSEQIEFEAKWSELGSEDMDLSRFRPVYSPKDFLEVLINMKSPNINITLSPDTGPSTNWGLIKVPLKVKSFHQLRLQFEEMSGNIDHLGLNILPFSNSDISKKCLKERVSLGKHVLDANQATVAREFCKRGCPATLRADLWSLILGVDISGAQKLNFKHLKSCVFQHDLLIDKLIFKDIHLTASNDDQYFVFEDLLYQGVLSLALSFETLLDEVEPQLAYHFSVHDIYPFTPRLKIAIKWIIKGFSGCLATDQILQLWDCMLAYDSTEIFVVLAVGIMSLRKPILLQAENQATVENILADISAVKVIPILHGMLNNTRYTGYAIGSSISR
ncbi:TBC1 domain family member 19-like isoform X4 [Stegodyphus dumicola]|uniref:TBC1 domain family member 19-like isoform X4 n=1 Tax=Stegodyphus dumicola TaxID=202533 RepID=UPI0015A850BC|nr:TBC1 domain family member 19-like isoform X4 [Stegodyphus dumicola]